MPDDINAEIDAWFQRSRAPIVQEFAWDIVQRYRLECFLISRFDERDWTDGGQSFGADKERRTESLNRHKDYLLRKARERLRARFTAMLAWAAMRDRT